MACFEGIYKDDLISNANTLGSSGRGILAIDENDETFDKRFYDYKIDNTETNRNAFRELLFTTPDALDFISGVILTEEGLHGKTSEGKPFRELFEENHVLPGVKVDIGQVWICCTNNETTTEGLCGLADRCQKLYAAGARFAKWRGYLHIADREPTDFAMHQNVDRLGRFAVIAQENGLVPVIQPEIMVQGSHDIGQMAHVTEWVIANLFRALIDHRVMLEAIVLRINMVTAGSEVPMDEPEAVAEHTVHALQRTVPPAVPSIVFLSGGHTEEDATRNLNAICSNGGRKPWSFSFAFGRALTQSTLKAWAGKAENKEKAQEVFMNRLRVNSEASYGCYDPSQEPENESENENEPENENKTETGTETQTQTRTQGSKDKLEIKDYEMDCS